VGAEGWHGAPLRVAFIGKGGAGKSTIAGTLARLLAARGETVVVLDSDPMPGLATTLGVRSTDAGVPDEAVEEVEGGRPPYRLVLPAEEAVERYSLAGPDGLRLLQLGKLRTHVRTVIRSQFAYRAIIAGLDDAPWHLVGDLPAGTRQPFFGWGSFADDLLVVVEPTAKSTLSGRRLARLATTDDAPRIVAVASKVDEGTDVGRIADRTGLEVIAAIPRDDAIAAADRAGRSLVDVAPDAPAVAAIGSLLDVLGERSVEP
jgi:CO dehydrogenase maturation factor